MIQQLTQLVQNFSELNTAVLLVALVLLFVVAFKVLEMVMQTVLVSALSGGFYFVLSYYLSSVSFSIDALLFFTFIGGTLYTGYHLIIMSFSIMSTLVSVPFKVVNHILDLLKKVFRKLKNLGDKEEQV